MFRARIVEKLSYNPCTYADFAFAAKSVLAGLAALSALKKSGCACIYTETHEQARSETFGRQARTAVLVRTHSPTAAQLERISAWASQCHQIADVDFFISVDISQQAGQASLPKITAALEAEGLNQNDIPVHQYCECEMENAYPVFTELRVALPYRASSKPSVCGRSLAWGFHCECVHLWRHSLRNPRQYDFVWVLEDDVGISGDLASLIFAYATDDADLLSSRFESKQPQLHDYFGCPPKPGWWWYHTTSTEYGRRVVGKIVSQEHVQSFSRKLLDELEDRSLSGASAWSEQMSPTVCFTEGMRCRRFRPEHIGEPYGWDGRVSEESWKKICAEAATDSRSPKMYHALKF